jgi:hypothetical protein
MPAKKKKKKKQPWSSLYQLHKTGQVKISLTHKPYNLHISLIKTPQNSNQAAWRQWRSHNGN